MLPGLGHWRTEHVPDLEGGVLRASQQETVSVGQGETQDCRVLGSSKVIEVSAVVKVPHCEASTRVGWVMAWLVELAPYPLLYEAISFSLPVTAMLLT